MSLTLSSAAKNASCNATVDLCEQGSGAGKLKIKATSTVLATITLHDAAFENSGTNGTPGQARAVGGDGTNPVSGGNPLSGTASATGTANVYDVTDSDDNVLWSGTVTATGGGGDLTLDNTSIANGQSIQITSWVHSQP